MDGFVLLAEEVVVVTAELTLELLTELVLLLELLWLVECEVEVEWECDVDFAVQGAVIVSVTVTVLPYPGGVARTAAASRPVARSERTLMVRNERLKVVWSALRYFGWRQNH